MASETKSTLKLAGQINWLYGSDHDVLGVEVSRAFLRSGNELVLTCETGGNRYTVALKRTAGPHFEGTFPVEKGGRTLEVKASCAWYSNEEGSLLIGDWTEEGYDYKWWAKLKEVSRFADEKPIDGA